MNIGGFSDTVFDVLAAFLKSEAGRFVKEIEAVKLSMKGPQGPDHEAQANLQLPFAGILCQFAKVLQHFILQLWEDLRDFVE